MHSRLEASLHGFLYVVEEGFFFFFFFYKNKNFIYFNFFVFKDIICILREIMGVICQFYYVAVGNSFATNSRYHTCLFNNDVAFKIIIRLVIDHY
jgi:hypothetical protein